MYMVEREPSIRTYVCTLSYELIEYQPGCIV